MPDPVTVIVALLGAVASLLAAGGGAVAWVVREIGQSRRESSEGRREIYTRIEQVRDRVAETVAAAEARAAETYARRDLTERDLAGLRQAVDEQHQTMTAMAGRLCPYESAPPRPRPPDPAE